VPLNEFLAIGIFFIVTTLFYYGYGWWKKSQKADEDSA